MFHSTKLWLLASDHVTVIEVGILNDMKTSSMGQSKFSATIGGVFYVAQ